ncbi:MAG: DciA family protein [Microbacteriaceae bacterium]|nr:DciA family protein [Microbacteriaceae bacterium]
MPDSPVNSSEAIRFFEHLVEIFSGRKRRQTEVPVVRKGSLPFEKGRDPRLIVSIVSRTITERGWAPFLSRESVIDQWEEIVGIDVAGHTVPEIDEDLITVRCDSSAWATNLRLMRHEILAEVLSRFPDSGLEKISVVGPGVPNKIRGPRSVKWRGPRDTYG